MCLPLKERLVFLGECPLPNLTAVAAPLDSLPMACLPHCEETRGWWPLSS